MSSGGKHRSGLAALALWDSIPADEDIIRAGSISDFVAAVRGELDASTKQVAAAPVLSTPPPQQSQVLAKMRSLVSQEKIRFQLDGFDLDLTYITPNIIAMGFPSSGKEALYRNPVEEVERFFNTRHPNRYRIYNLCSERDYDTPGRFQGRYKRFPFDDHNAPCPIKLIPDMCRDAAEFLRQHVDNVVAVHCKAGKGRTGVMVSCLLRALESAKFKSAENALDFFGNVRTADGKGVTIPSQKRYVKYWDVMLQYCQGKEPPMRTVQLQSLRVESQIKTSGSVEVYFTVDENNKEKFDSRRLFPSGGKRSEDGHLVFSFREGTPFLQLSGDIRFIFYQRNSLLADEELFHFWINTSLCQATERLTKADNDLDGKPAKSRDVIFAPALAVELSFTGTFVRPEGRAGSSGGTSSADPAHADDTASRKDSSTTTRSNVKEKGFFKKMFAA